MSKFNATILQELDDKMTEFGVSSEFKRCLMDTGVSLMEEEEVKRFNIDKKLITSQAVVKAFGGGKFSGGNDRLVMYDINTVEGKAIWEHQGIVGKVKEVCAFFKLAGKNALYSVIAPNPGNVSEDAYNWCMVTLTDLAAESMARKEGI